MLRGNLLKNTDTAKEAAKEKKKHARTAKAAEGKEETKDVDPHEAKKFKSK